MTPFIEIIDKYGRRRRARPGEIAADGETLNFPIQFMDTAARAAHDALAQRFGLSDSKPQGFRRGYAFAQDMAIVSNDAAAEAATRAYESKRERIETSRRHTSDGTPQQAYDERTRRLENAWREQKNNSAPAVAQNATQDARTIANQAWLDKKERLQNAYRNS